MTSKENQEFLENALENAKKGVTPQEKQYTDEDLWHDIKLKARAFLIEDSLCITDEDRESLKKRIDSFSKFGPSLIKACSEREKSKYLMEDIKVRKAHELNEAARLYTSNPSNGAIVDKMSQMLDAPIPQTEQKVIETKEAIETGVSLRGDI